MKFNLNTPCAECPFLPTSPRGWLGPDKAEDVIAQVRGEGGYACHMDVTKKIGEKAIIPSSAVEHCVGALLCAVKSNKLYRTRDAMDAQMRLNAECEVEVMSPQEFLSHHDLTQISRDLAKARRKKSSSKRRRAR